jgi:rod shape-determining protein MreD
MRWFTFGIVVFVTLVMQVGIVRLFGLGPQRVMPDLFLILAVILGFRAPSEQAPIAGWILGIVKDLSSEAPLGAYAIAFGLMVWAIVRLREFFYGDNPITLMLLTFISSFLVEQFALLVCRIKGVLPGGSYGSICIAIGFSALLTAGLTPYGHWLVMKLYRQLGLPKRRTYGR